MQDLAKPGRFGVFAIQLRNKLIRRYSSRGAQRYETRRQSARWIGEARAFDYFYERVDPQSVLDCPVGTGRWFDRYRGNGARVLGVDISQEMLSEAAEKVPADETIGLKRADVLDPRDPPSALGQGYDLIVCTRFVYWLRPAELAIMLEKFTATEAPLLLASAKVTLEREPEEPSYSRGLIGRLDRLRAHFYRAVVKRVYREETLLKIFEANGWRLAERQPVVTTRSVRYFYYLFARADSHR